MDGKTAIVTGAAGKQGLGHAIALRLAQAGADVMVSDVSLWGVRHTEDDYIERWQGLKDVVAEIKALGRRGREIETDITSNQQVEEMVASCIADFGKIDILVNNAGVLGPISVPALEIPEEDWYKVLAVNIMGTYLCSKEVAKRMIELGQGGKIINLSSVVGKLAWGKAGGPYIVSKFGVLSLPGTGFRVGAE